MTECESSDHHANSPDQGITLDKLGQFLASHSVKVDVHYGSDITLNEFHNLVTENLQ